MSNRDSKTEHRSAERIAFEHYLRTGRILSPSAPLERKFNPYHDPRNGQFTFAPGGPRSLANVVISRQKRSLGGDLSKNITRAAGNAPSATQSIPPPGMRDAVYPPGENGADFQLAQYRPNPRARIGGNGGPPLNDPMTLERVFPGLVSSPGGSILGLADNIFDLSGPAFRLSMSLLNDHIEMLIKQIQRINPQYKLDTLGFPKTIEGYNNLVRQLRVDRAVEFYTKKQEIRPLQVEVLRYLQEQTDIAYDTAVKEYDRGRLSVRLSREEAIGNYIDRVVRNHLKNFYNMKNIRPSSTGIIRIVGREYDTSQSESSYRIPDARVGDVAFDVSLTRKTLKTRQVEGFFNGDFKPSFVIIVRPSQLGPNNTYVIKRQGK